MIYDGSGVYTVYTENQTIQLTEADIRKIAYEFISVSDGVEPIEMIEACIDRIRETSSENPLIVSSAKQMVNISLKHIHKSIPKRSHNKKSLVIKLFEKYHDANKTKKQTFERIASELNITVKAVEKSYYLK